jgi:biopolymer transport protein TolQ
MSISDHSDIIQLVLHSGPMVRFVLFLLLAFSVGTWAIIFTKYRTLKKAQKESVFFLDLLWKNANLSDAFNASKKLRYSPVSKVFRVAYVEFRKLAATPSTTDEGKNRQALQSHHSQMTIDSVQRSLRRAINVELAGLNKALPFLATTGNTAPFIGLFGTVWGIMNAFRGIGLRGSATLAVVAPGISEALIATAAGLAAAIPAVVAYNYFSNRLGVLETEMNNFSSDFLNLIERRLTLKKEG